MKLPKEYLVQMRNLLGPEYDAWSTAMDQEPFQGLRINCSKIDRKQWETIRPYVGESVAWADNGYYYDSKDRPALDPYYYAGLYYLQEPSAMAPVTFLQVQPGDKVLDLCAAPGGKSTEMGAILKGSDGLLVSNDFSHSRAKALLKNLERFGIVDMAVVSEAPKRLADVFDCFFDKILVDAPCSGEGMFRKDPQLVKHWEEHGPEYYVPIQREILKQAVRMLKPGGWLLYSTCTFDERENEENIVWILKEEPELRTVALPEVSGVPKSAYANAFLRLFPHRVRGEGHFLALLKKQEKICMDVAGNDVQGMERDLQVARLEKESDFLRWERCFDQPFDRDRMVIRNGQVYLWPKALPLSVKLRYLRTGLLLGEWKKQRFEPSQAAAMAVKRGDFSQIFSMVREDKRVIRYLKGETIFLKENENLPKGWILVCVDGYPLGWAKYTGAVLKNKYDAGWRWQS